MPALLVFNPYYLRAIRLLRNCFKAVKLTLATSSALVLFSCDNYRAAEPVNTQYVKVKNVNSDTIIVIPNEKLATAARIAFNETLSDTALVRISPDTAFSKHGTLFLLPIKNPPLMTVGGLSGDSLFIQYQRHKKPISGDLTIEITFQE